MFSGHIKINIKWRRLVIFCPKIYERVASLINTELHIADHLLQAFQSGKHQHIGRSQMYTC